MINIPNLLSLLRILMTPFFIYSFFQPGLSWKLLTLFLFVLSTLTDKVDGYLARKYECETAFGKFIDPLADKILITSAFICLVLYGIMAIWMVVIIIMRDIIVTYLRSYGRRVGSPVHTMEIARWKTGVQSIVIYTALIYMTIKEIFLRYSIYSPVVQKIDEWNIIYLFMLTATLFTLITGIIYIINNRHLFVLKKG